MSWELFSIGVGVVDPSRKTDFVHNLGIDDHPRLLGEPFEFIRPYEPRPKDSPAVNGKRATGDSAANHDSSLAQLALCGCYVGGFSRDPISHLNHVVRITER